MKKKNATLIISLIVLVIIAIAFLFIGYAISGADIIAWLKSKWAITIYVAITVYALIVAGILIRERIKKL